MRKLDQLSGLPSTLPDIDPKHFSSVMGAFPTGVAITATEWAGKLFGATINSLTSVSLTLCMLFVLYQRRQRDGEWQSANADCFR